MKREELSEREQQSKISMGDPQLITIVGEKGKVRSVGTREMTSKGPKRRRAGSARYQFRKKSSLKGATGKGKEKKACRSKSAWEKEKELWVSKL